MNPFIRLKNSIMSRISPPPVEIDIREAGGSGAQVTNANVKNLVIKAVGNVDDSLTQDFNPPDSTLSEIADAIETDSYLKLAVTKYSQLIFKAGYHIVSNNDAAAEYIQSRLNIMSFTTGTPMDILFQQIADDLVRYSNAFLLKSRGEQPKIGNIQAKGILEAQPVVGYFRVDPTTMQIKVDKTGTIKNYQQEVGNTTKKYKPTDVIHFFIDKRGGELFGIPRIAAALEDVKMLRKIEGNILKLIYRYSSPLMQMQLGIPEPGLMATDKEIKEARSEIEKLADDGIFITNERTKFFLIGAEGAALDATGYVKYFESRVFSALSLSYATVGRGGAKQDADSMEEQVHDSVKFFQKTIQTFIEHKIFTELLMEGGYNPLINMDDMVFFKFEEINLETKVKMQTHAMNIFHGNGITHEEFRNWIGLKTDDVDESRLYDNMIKHKNALELVAAKVGTGTGVTANAGNSGPDKQDTTDKTADNIITPENQHGKTSVKIKESLEKNPRKSENSRKKNKKKSKNITSYKKKFSEVYKKYCAASNDICENGTEPKLVLPIARDEIARAIHNHVISDAENGYRRAIRDAGRKPRFTPKIDSVEIVGRVDKHLENMLKDIQSKLDSAKNSLEMRSAFDSSEYRLRFLADHVASKAYWYAYVKTAQALGIPRVYVEFNEGSEDAKEHPRVIRTNHFSLDDIPAFHPYCGCTLKIKAGEK